MPGRHEDTGCVVLEPRLGLALGVLAAVALALVCLAALAFAEQGLAGMPYAMLAAGAFLVASIGVSAALDRWPRRRVARLVADGEGIRLDGRLVRERARLKSGHLRRRRGGGWAVHVSVRRGLPMDLGVRDEAEGERLLEAMGLDATRSTTTFYAIEGGSRRRGRMVAVLGVPVVVSIMFVVICTMLHRKDVLRATGPYANLAFFGWLWWSIAFGGLVRVVVGSDGIAVHRLLGRNRYVPLADIDDVGLEGSDVVVTCRSQPPLRLGRAATRPGPFVSESADEILHRIERARLGRATDEAPPLTVLARGERSTSAWLKALEALADEARASYRGATVPRHALWSVVEDTRAAPDVRAGAAAAMRADLDDAGRERIRVAAEACASPELRVALTAVAAAEDEQALEDALDALREG